MRFSRVAKRVFLPAWQFYGLPHMPRLITPPRPRIAYSVHLARTEFTNRASKSGPVSPGSPESFVKYSRFLIEISEWDGSEGETSALSQSPCLSRLLSRVNLSRSSLNTTKSRSSIATVRPASCADHRPARPRRRSGGAGYSHRWNVELFIRWLKCVLGSRHLIAENRNCLTLQMYSALIFSLFIVLRTGRKPTKRTFVMIHFHLLGWVSDEEFDAHLAALSAAKRSCMQIRRAEPYCLRGLGDFYFVLGNRNFYRGSIASVRAMVRDLCLEVPGLHWMPDAGVVPLSAETSLVGHDVCADGRIGD